MSSNPAAPVTVKEFRFYPESQMVTVVFESDKSVDFTGEDNYKPAHHAAVKASHFDTATPSIELTDDAGVTIALNIPAGTPHETFEA